jgi:Na+/phosphate symporter
MIEIEIAGKILLGLGLMFTGVQMFSFIGMGLGLIFFGIETMTAGVKPLSHETWFTGAMTFNGIDRFPVKSCHGYAEIKYS